MYERTKIVNGREYRYLVKSVRVGKTVKQNVIKYLGPVDPIYKNEEQKIRKSNAWLFARSPTELELQKLKSALKSSSAFTRDRARIILFSISGFQCKEIAGKIGCEIRKVRNAIKKFSHEGLKSLEKGKAPGSIPKFTKEQKAQMLKICAMNPEKLGMHFTTWSLEKLRRYYVEKGILDDDPFITLDKTGTGLLMKIGVDKAKKVKKNLKLGICGEHGGDPESIEFCYKIGLDYVSCSPYRVPIARLAAAQAVLKKKMKKDLSKSTV